MDFLKFAILFSLVFSNPACKDDCPDNLMQYEYTLALEDGIYVEKFDPDITDSERYNSNNEIYTICREFIFDYYYEDVDGNQFLFEREKGDMVLGGEEFENWFFVPRNDPGKRTIVKFQNKVSGGLKPFIEFDPTFNQTIFRFYDIQENGKSQERGRTGLIENERNVWLHPHRHGLFAMTEFAPFPYIQSPYEIGNSWEWDYISLSAENWSDPRWLEFEGQLEIVSNYEITDVKYMDTPLGQLQCFEITAVATNEYGAAKLVSYFNEEYGFVKLDYANIDGSKLFMNLIEVKEH